MENLEQSPADIEELARQTHYELRKSLISLRFNPPKEEPPLVMLQNRVASLMRELDEFHFSLFVRKELQKFGFKVETTPDEYLGYSIERVKEYQEWRLRRLASDAEELRTENKGLWEKLFKPPLYRIGVGSGLMSLPFPPRLRSYVTKALPTARGQGKDEMEKSTSFKNTDDRRCFWTFQ